MDVIVRVWSKALCGRPNFRDLEQLGSLHVQISTELSPCWIFQLPLTTEPCFNFFNVLLVVNLFLHGPCCTGFVQMEVSRCFGCTYTLWKQEKYSLVVIQLLILLASQVHIHVQHHQNKWCGYFVCGLSEQIYPQRCSLGLASLQGHVLQYAGSNWQSNLH